MCTTILSQFISTYANYTEPNVFFLHLRKINNYML